MCSAVCQLHLKNKQFIDKNMRFVVNRGDKVGSREGKGEKDESGQNILLVAK